MLKIDWLAKDIGVIPEFLSVEECNAYIRLSESKGYEDAPVSTLQGMVIMKDLRNNDRVIIDDTHEAAFLFNRVQPFLPSMVEKNWRSCGLNERLRFYRYYKGQQFDWHHDGYYENPVGERSFYTFIIYLNEGFDGGETVFAQLSYRRKGDDGLTVSPRKGMALLFRHEILHKGAAVSSGRKYVLRSDVMCSRWPRLSLVPSGS